MKEIQILRVVEKPQRRFNLAPANAQPWREAIVGKPPIERGMPAPKLAKIAIINLSANVKVVGSLGGGVRPKIGELTAAHVAGVHGQPVVFVGVDESLRGEPVDLHLPVEKCETLRMDRHPGRAQANG